jgi:MFS family permease
MTPVAASTRTVLTVPGAPSMAVWSLAGRFGFSMMNLSLLLFVQAETGSYATAGALSAASLLGTAAGTVVQGRLIDRYGPTRPLLTLALPHAALSAAVISGVSAGTRPAALAVVIAAQCAALPTVAVASRTMWPHLVPVGRVRDAAYSYEAVSFELCWLLGPAAAGLLATLLWPGTALLVAVTLATVSAVGFALTGAVRSHRGHSAGAGQAGAAAAVAAVHRRGVATLLCATTGFGLGIGFVVVGVSAGTAAGGAPELAGILLAVWSISSVLGGLAYQRWPRPRGLAARLPALLSAFGLLLGIPFLLDGVAALAAMMVLTGSTLVPQVSTQNSVLDRLVPATRLTEAYGWVTTVIAVANAGGQAAGGVVIERYGHRAGFLAAAACVVPLALAVWAGRRYLLGATAR